MANLYDNSFTDRVRDTVNIVEVISDYVNVKQVSGGDFLGLCPFHNEKTPSFRIHPEQGFYKCFGCGRGGNVFTFIMEMEGLSFPEALKTLAEKAGLELPEQVTDPNYQKQRNEREKLFHAMQRAANWFHSRLTGGISKANPTTFKPISENGQKALKYLLDRGIDSNIITRYQIGWAESEWDGLVKAAQKSGVQGQLLVQAGLGHQKRDGQGFVDKFRARIMFPILNLAGKPVAFGGRRVDGITQDSENAKYINSPETTVYHKSEHLYGLYNSREFIRQQDAVYVVEGYTDLLALVQAEVNNVVASLGTAFTPTQARLIRRFTKNVFIVYDSDVAGIEAAVRAANILVQSGLEA